MGFTNQQQKAINSNQGNVAVTAGAGSGKTSVLTQRIVTNIINNNVNLDQLLVLTFTKDASNEMKERIKQKLSENDKTKHLVINVDSADICTFDSYQLNLVKKYFDKLKVSCDVTIIPDELIKVKSWEYIDEIFNNLIDNNPLFNELIESYCIKDTKELAAFVEKIANMISKNGFSYVQELLNQDFDKKYNDWANQIIDVINGWIEEKNLENSEQKRRKNKTIINKISSIEEIDENLVSKITMDKIKDQSGFLGVKADFVFLFKNFALIKEKEIYFNNKFMPLIVEIAQELNNRISNFKKDKNAYTYSDISNLATNLLIEHEDIRNEIKNNLKMIVIDEYQDTSKEQEKFISLISNNNTFIVGDIKQSIYGFRNAFPEQFNEKCKLYDSNPKLGNHINMNDNFRSRKEVIDRINKIFRELMNRENSDIKYGEDEEIKYPITSIYEDPKAQDLENQEYGIYKIYFTKDGKKKDDEKNDEKIKEIIANIKAKINNKVKVLDKNNNNSTEKLKPCKYKDFAILAETKTDFEKIEKAFIENGIPINAIYDRKIIKDQSVDTIINLLTLINSINENDQQINVQKHLFFSIARSYIFQYTDKQLFDMREKEWRNDPAFLKIEKFAHDNKNSYLKDIFFNLINEFNLLEKVAILDKTHDALDSLVNNNILYNRILEMDKLGYGIKEFILFLEKLNDLNIEIETSNSNIVENAVKLTTIHKSKGLEYPIVYLYMRDSKNNNHNEKTGKFWLDEKYGLSLPSFYTFDSKPLICILKKMLFGNDKEKENQEKIRLLYVALTRARETMILVCSENSNNIFYKLLDKECCELENIPNAKNDYNNTTINDPTTNNNKINNDKTLQIKKFEYEFKKNIFYHKASNELNENVNLDNLQLGTELHLLMECIDFNNLDTSFIKDEKKKKMIDSVLTNPIFNNIKQGKIYQEYSFNNEVDFTIGIIDLFVEYNDHIDIIDYKLSNIDPEKYKNQLLIYKEYLSKIFPNKIINCYLLSIIDNKVQKIEC